MSEVSAEDSVRIERTLEAPISLVWEMWTTSEHFAAWYGPTGATIPVANMDVTVGGKRHICMAMDTPDGEMKMWFVGEYLEIDEPSRLVYTESMSDEEGNAQSPATQVVVELSEAGEQTNMVMTHVGVPADSPGGGGWAMAIDKLVERLAQS